MDGERKIRLARGSGKDARGGRDVSGTGRQTFALRLKSFNLHRVLLSQAHFVFMAQEGCISHSLEAACRGPSVTCLGGVCCSEKAKDGTRVILRLSCVLCGMKVTWFP